MEDGKVPQTTTTATAQSAKESLYNLSFFDNEFAPIRKQLIRTLLVPLIYTSLLMWGCLSLYYGSLISSHNLSKLDVYAVDLDGGFLGQQMIDGIKKSQTTSTGGLRWQVTAAINSTEMSRNLVLNEQAWAVLESLLALFANFAPLPAFPYPLQSLDHPLTHVEASSFPKCLSKS